MLRPLVLIVALASLTILPIAHAQCFTKVDFLTKPDTNWVGSSKTKESQTSPPENAEQICDLDANCLAFNSFGYYILKQADTAATIEAAGIKLEPYDGLCTYVKASALPSCPDKAGYITKDNTNWAGSAKTKESQTSPENAEKVCNLDANCLAWNNFGYYILKQADTAAKIDAAGIKFSAYDGMCTYVKKSALSTCPNKAGYVTKEATNWAGNTKTKESQVVPENAEKICNLDSNCLAWNSYGYYLLKSTDVPLSIAAAGVSFSPYDELCTYVKQAALSAQATSNNNNKNNQQQAATGQVSPANQQNKGVAFRNAASRQCFAVNDNNRLPLWGTPRLLSTTCSASDKSQGFKVVSVGKAYNIIDSQGRCLTSYSGILIVSAGFVKCGSNRSDQLWAVRSINSNGKGPYLIQSNQSGTCISIEGGSVTLDGCNARDATMLFDSAFV